MREGRATRHDHGDEFGSGLRNDVGSERTDTGAGLRNNEITLGWRDKVAR